MSAGIFVGAFAVIVGSCRAKRPDATPAPGTSPSGYAGSVRCRECHARFYELWATSRHGLAMQPFSAALARERLTEPEQDLEVAGRRFRAEPGAGQVRERGQPADVLHPIVQVLGGKNVYYFLTPEARGRLQVLPVAYDVRRREWYDVGKSGMRHFTDVAEPTLPWTAPEFTFNASCHACHVSQLRSNYDLATDTYQTTWAEPGINCETCHGPGEAHARAFRAAGPGPVPTEPLLVVARTLTHEERNDLCASCHARLSPIAGSFQPGQRYFDAFDLIGIENRDFHPDGRDLGENYTFTSWRMSACVSSGQLDCMHCHTSSGRYRWQETAQANQACLPCHAAKAHEGSGHTHHREGSATCVDCHMPKTEFARMVRSDHSMRPPAPAASLAFGSPNACNLCHANQNASWSDRAVRKWHARDYQARVLRQGRLVAAARRGDWRELPAMLGALAGVERDEVMTVGLLRLLRSCPSDDKWPAVLAAVADPSPWVRAAAAEALGEHLAPDVVAALLEVTRDPVRLPRIRAANALASLPRSAVPEGARTALAAATRELEASLSARPDDFASHYDLGRLLAGRGETARAIAAYETALRQRPDLVAAMVNLSLLYNAVSRNADAERVLRRALELEPGNAAAHLNLGMLQGELGRFAEAETALRAACREDPSSAVAAYNLAVVLARDRVAEAVTWSRRASALAPASPKYAYTWAFYLARTGDRPAAITVLRRAIEGQAAGEETYALLGQLLREAGRNAEADTLLLRAANDARLPASARATFAGRRPLP